MMKGVFLSKEEVGKSSLNLNVSLALKLVLDLDVSIGLGSVFSALFPRLKVMLYLGPKPLSSLNFRSSKAPMLFLSVTRIDVLGR